MNLDAAGLNWLSQHDIAPTVVGLVFNLIGAVLVAIAQGRLFRVLNVWLMGLAFNVETLLQPEEPIVTIWLGRGRWLKLSRKVERFSTLGWILIVLGTALQIPATFPK